MKNHSRGGDSEFQEAVEDATNTRIGPYIENSLQPMIGKVHGASASRAPSAKRSMNGMMSKMIEVWKTNDNIPVWM